VSAVDTDADPAWFDPEAGALSPVASPQHALCAACGSHCDGAVAKDQQPAAQAHEPTMDAARQLRTSAVTPSYVPVDLSLALAAGSVSVEVGGTRQSPVWTVRPSSSSSTHPRVPSAASQQTRPSPVLEPEDSEHQVPVSVSAVIGDSAARGVTPHQQDAAQRLVSLVGSDVPTSTSGSPALCLPLFVGAAQSAPVEVPPIASDGDGDGDGDGRCSAHSCPGSDDELDAVFGMV
jgi:hypothetical protein